MVSSELVTFPGPWLFTNVRRYEKNELKNLMVKRKLGLTPVLLFLLHLQKNVQQQLRFQLAHILEGRHCFAGRAIGGRSGQQYSWRMWMNPILFCADFPRRFCKRS
jgi:hypothetical protein